MGCQKAEKKWIVNYEIELLSGSVNEYRVRLLDPNGVEVTLNPVFKDKWKSSSYLFSSGSHTFFEVELLKSTNSDLNIRILRDGAVHEAGKIVKGERKKRISDNI